MARLLPLSLTLTLALALPAVHKMIFAFLSLFLFFLSSPVLSSFDLLIYLLKRVASCFYLI